MLKGSVQRIIPENLEDVDQGFQLLKALYGDPSRVMKAKKAKLKAMGNFPKPGSKQPSHLKMQVDSAFQSILQNLQKEVILRHRKIILIEPQVIIQMNLFHQ